MVSRLHVSDFRQVGCTHRLSLCIFMQCKMLMIEQEWQKNTMCHCQHPCLRLLFTPGCQEPWSPPGSTLGRFVVDLESSILPHSVSEMSNPRLAAGMDLPVGWKGKIPLAWNNFSYTFFFCCLRSFSMCLHL